MALADRSYFRSETHTPRVCTLLIIGLLALFFIQCIALIYGGWDASRPFGLTVHGIKEGRIWQLLTFQFLHAAPWPWHVLGNCLGLYFFGRPVEETLGAKKFLKLYFTAGTIGGLLQVLTTALLPHHLDASVVGASAGVCGMVATYCALNPMTDLTVFIYFFPVTIRARFILWFLTLLSIFGTIIPFDNVAHAAHLGGLLVGIGYVRWFHESNRLAEFLARFKRPARPRLKVIERTPRRSTPEKSPSPSMANTEFISREVDPILDKIAAQGIHSLTDEEKRILENARARMEKR